MAEVFVSYRRADTHAEEIAKGLEALLYPGAVFLDTHYPDMGRFRETLQAQVNGCRVVLVVLGEAFFGRMNDLTKTDDPVALELRAAIQCKKIIPVLACPRRLDEFIWPNEFAALSSQQQNYLGVWPASNRPSDIELALPRLRDAVTPHLTEYWKRLCAEESNRAGRRRLYLKLTMSVVVPLVLLSGLAVGRYGLGRPGEVVVAHTRSPLPKSPPVAAGTVDDVAAPYPPTGKQAPAAEMAAWETDFWLRDYVDNLGQNLPFQTAQVRVLTWKAGEGYDGGTLRLGVTERYQVQAKAAFLRRGDGRGDGTYRPVYRQLTLSQQQRPDGVKSPDWSIEVPPVDTGEVLILVVIVRQAEARPWPHPKEFLFTLERT